MIKTFIKRVAATVAAFAAATAVFAQVSMLPVEEIDGRIYYYYIVAPKETVYSLQHKLQISKEDIIRFNPSVAEGLKAGAKLYFPYESVPSKMHPPRKQEGPVGDTYTVRNGETLFGLAKRFGITEQQLLEMNPQLKRGLQAGDVITVPEIMTAVPADAPSVSAGRGYVVKEKETFYSIARDHGVSVAELEAANPDVSILRKGQVLTIPEKADADKPVAVPETPASAPESPELAEIPAIPAEEIPAEDEEIDEDINIALILPFMLRQDPVSRQAQRYTEFYKGFLLAADSLRRSGKTINIRAYDSAGSLDSVRVILSDPMLRDMDIVIAPDNAPELMAIGNWGKANDVMVFNTFNVKDDSYQKNPVMMQANIPSAAMYDKAASAFVTLLGNDTPVVIRRKGAAPDKTEFMAALDGRLAAKGVTPVIIEFDGKLTPADLADLDPMGNYMFIPVTGKQTELNKMLPGIASWRESKVTPGIRVFGFPEWTTFKGETLQNMHALNTLVYSRFTVDESSHRNNEFDRRFKRWYGNEMENVAPRQGLLGFDSGIYIIRLLLTDGSPDSLQYGGIQNDFNFTRSEGGGWVNNALSFINYRPSGSTEKISL